MFCRSGAVQVRPKSSLARSTLPQWKLRVAAKARRRPARPSYATAYTDSPGKCGPSMRHFFRFTSDQKKKAPLTVPTITKTSAGAFDRRAVDFFVGRLLGDDF